MICHCDNAWHDIVMMHDMTLWECMIWHCENAIVGVPSIALMAIVAIVLRGSDQLTGQTRDAQECE